MLPLRHAASRPTKATPPTRTIHRLRAITYILDFKVIIIGPNLKSAS